MFKLSKRNQKNQDSEKSTLENKIMARLDIIRDDLDLIIGKISSLQAQTQENPREIKKVAKPKKATKKRAPKRRFPDKYKFIKNQIDGLKIGQEIRLNKYEWEPIIPIRSNTGGPNYSTLYSHAQKTGIKISVGFVKQKIVIKRVE